MTETNNILWQKINRFQLDEPGVDLSFSDRLARENGWTLQYALRSVQEYKKFMFLICIAPHPLTPSDQVDQVWHLHLLYTQSYWKDFCGAVLGREVHHGPTKGGGAERDKFTDWYAKTKELYAQIFKEQPPADIWPPSSIRFGKTNFKRINVDDNWIIPKPKIKRK
jgi:hypothetical protein